MSQPWTTRRIAARLLQLAVVQWAVVILLWAVKPASSTMECLQRVLRGEVGADSSFFIESAWQALQAGRPVYRVLFFEEHMKFQYPTSSVLLASAAHGLGVSTHAATAGLVLVSAALTLVLAGEVFLLAAPGQGADGAYRWQVRGLVAALGVSFYPLVNGVDLGQIQTVITCLFTLAVWFWLRRRVSAAAVCLAVICIFKPQMIVFLVWAAVRRQWRFLGTFAAAFAVVQVVAIGCYGWRNEVDYLAVLSYMGHRGEVIFENQSINGWLERAFGSGLGMSSPYFTYPPYNAGIYVGTVVSSAGLLLLGLVAPARRGYAGSGRDFVLFGMLATMASPIAWTHHYGLFFVACIYLMAVSLRERGELPWVLAGCYLVLANYLHYLGRYALNRWVDLLQSPVLYAGLVLVVWTAFRVRDGGSPTGGAGEVPLSAASQRALDC